jgi:thiamine-phosphate pyrophosphorylase
MKVPRLVLLTDRSQLPPGRDLVETVHACAEAGLRQVVVREHDLDSATRRRLVADLVAVGDLTVLASRVPVKAAHGLHLAAEQEWTGGGWFGRSCHDPVQIRWAAVEGAAYVTLSPFSATSSKPGYGPPVQRSDYAVDAGVPVLALGGVDPGNAAAARVAGAHGVAVMGCVMRAADPGAVVRRLLREVGP